NYLHGPSSRQVMAEQHKSPSSAGRPTSHFRQLARETITGGTRGAGVPGGTGNGSGGAGAGDGSGGFGIGGRGSVGGSSGNGSGGRGTGGMVSGGRGSMSGRFIFIILIKFRPSLFWYSRALES